ncbi:MAG: LytTR family DNA-binding domain-containing protein [Bacilli bacterium]
MLRIAIIENEEKQIDLTIGMIKRYCSEKEIIFEVTSFTSGFDFLESNLSLFDLAFMDIDMPGINGMETAVKLRKTGFNTVLIFVTNLPQYAIEGYKVEALDFILKPMTYADFSLAMSRVEKTVLSSKNSEFVLNIHGAVRKFKAEDVLFFEMIKHDVCIHLVDEPDVVFRFSLTKIEKIISEEIFFKCNSGCLVNIKKVKSVQGEVLIMEDDSRIIVSRSHRKEVMIKLNSVYSESFLPKA